MMDRVEIGIRIVMGLLGVALAGYAVYELIQARDLTLVILSVLMGAFGVMILADSLTRPRR